MQVERNITSRFLKSAYLLAVCALIIGTGTARADGPAGPGSLPGGVIVNDSDTTGEQWGRDGGRTIEFTVNNPANFTALTWGAVGAAAVTMAFDGTIDAAGETLALGSVMNGQAVWNGTASLPLAGGGALVLSTRFTLTVVDGLSAPVPLLSDPAGNQPGLDVLLANGSFAATLLFEAHHNGTFGIPGGWTPVLDLFDDPNLPTIPGNPPGSTGPVLTGFNSGFFFEVLQGLALEEHDENMSSQTEMIKNALVFLTTDAINRLQILGEDHTGIHTWVNANHQEVLLRLEQVLLALPDVQLPPDIASSEDVRQAQEDLQDILLILFGIMPCPEGAEGCPEGESLQLFASPESVQMVKADVQALLTKVMDIQSTLEASASMPEINVQVAEVSHDASGKSRRWILTTTINGKLVDVELVKSSAVIIKKTDPAITAEVTGFAVPVSIGLGLLDVGMELPRALSKATVFRFDVFFDDGEVTAYGSALVRSLRKGDDQD